MSAVGGASVCARRRKSASRLWKRVVAAADRDEAGGASMENGCGGWSRVAGRQVAGWRRGEGAGGGEEGRQVRDVGTGAGPQEGVRGAGDGGRGARVGRPPEVGRGGEDGSWLRRRRGVQGGDGERRCCSRRLETSGSGE